MFAAYHIVQWFGEDSFREELTPPTDAQLSNLIWHVLVRDYIASLNHNWR